MDHGAAKFKVLLCILFFALSGLFCFLVYDSLHSIGRDNLFCTEPPPRLESFMVESIPIESLPIANQRVSLYMQKILAYKAYIEACNQRISPARSLEILKILSGMLPSFLTALVALFSVVSVIDVSKNYLDGKLRISMRSKGDINKQSSQDDEV
jgi:hypothetical protein